MNSHSSVKPHTIDNKLEEEEKENMRPAPQVKAQDAPTNSMVMMIDTSSKPAKGSSAPIFKHFWPL